MSTTLGEADAAVTPPPMPTNTSATAMVTATATRRITDMFPPVDPPAPPVPVDPTLAAPKSPGQVERPAVRPEDRTTTSDARRIVHARCGWRGLPHCPCGRRRLRRREHL